MKNNPRNYSPHISFPIPMSIYVWTWESNDFLQTLVYAKITTLILRNSHSKIMLNDINQSKLWLWQLSWSGLCLHSEDTQALSFPESVTLHSK